MIDRREVRLDHLCAMTDHRGVFEHADGAVRRLEHGYCTDDNARMLVVTSRESDVGSVHHLSRISFGFTLASQAPDGRVRNRMDQDGHWTDRPSTDDAWGRSVWAFGVAATQHDDPVLRETALAAFDRGVRQRSPWPRAMAFAALGAADVLAADPRHDGARALLRDTIAAIPATPPGSWAWPEPRLSYANATLAEAIIAAGAGLGDSRVLSRGLDMLAWLLELETRSGRLSVCGVGGRGPNDLEAQFDQQPIEVAAMADACWRAHARTGDRRWSNGITMAGAWFDGSNDTGAVMRDDTTGGAFDGLRPDGVNINQGAESTLALISTMQRAYAAVAVR